MTIYFPAHDWQLHIYYLLNPRDNLKIDIVILTLEINLKKGEISKSFKDT